MKDKLTAGLLAILLGGLGFHKFYIGKHSQGIIYLLFCWTGIPFVIGFIEGILYISCSSNKEFNYKYVPIEVRREISEKLQKEEAEMSKESSSHKKESNFDDIKKLKELLDMGAISQEEFETQKKKILENMG